MNVTTHLSDRSISGAAARVAAYARGLLAAGRKNTRGA